MTMKIKPVRTSRDRKEFIQLPYKLHLKCQAWVAPLLSEVITALDPNRNPFFEHARMEQFIAQVNGKTAGRIAAIIDENYIQVENEAIGLFGFFDAVNDHDVANALFNTASQWLREQGMVRMLGPSNPSMNDEIGVLINAFDIPAAIKMVWNPPYYPLLYDNAGFNKAMDFFAWNLEKENTSERLLKMGKLILKRSKVTFRHPDMKRFDEEIKIFRELYNQAWSENWGFVPWTETEFNHAAKGLKQILDPKLVLIAELDNKPVGFSIALPDMNFALKRINGRLFPFGLLKLLWYSRKIHRIRIPILGVAKEYRNRGIDTAMYYETWRIGTEKGFDGCEMSWILENNTQMNRAAKMMGADLYKTYRLYERPL